jgi:hypothetical protein
MKQMALFDHYVDSVTLSASRDPLLRTKQRMSPLGVIISAGMIVGAVAAAVLL